MKTAGMLGTVALILVSLAIMISELSLPVKLLQMAVFWAICAFIAHASGFRYVDDIQR